MGLADLFKLVLQKLILIFLLTSEVSLNSSTHLDRVCWVCLETESSTIVDEKWSHPCRCKGATKWVHLNCLQRWIDEQEANAPSSTPVSCRLCKTEYVILYPPDSLLFRFLAAADQRTAILSVYLTGGMISASIYWAALSYGAVTVMQIWGHQVGLRAMMETDPLLLLLALPSVPTCLLLGKLVPWPEMLRSFWRRCLSKLWPVKCLLYANPPTWPMREQTLDSPGEGRNYFRYFCGALALPTLSNVVGHMFFPRVSSNFYRVILGGFTYLLVQGVLVATYQELLYVRTSYRLVQDYQEDA